MSFIDDYIKYAETRTDAPPMYHHLGAISAVASVLGNKVWVQYGPQKLYPNLYILLLGPSSAFRKTTCLNMAKTLILKVNPDRVLPNEFSQEALLDVLSSRPQGTFFFSEFHSLMGLLSKDYMAGAKAFLADLYDSPLFYSRETKKGKVQIENPCISLLSASTQEWFLKGLREEDFLAGFLARFVILSETEKERCIAWPKDPDIAQENNLVKQLKVISELKGEMDVTVKVLREYCKEGGTVVKDYGAVAKDVYENWYYETFEPEYLNGRYTIFRPFFDRLATTCIKFAMIYAASKGRTAVLEEDFLDSQMLVEGLAGGLLRLEQEQITFGKAQSLRKKVKDIVRQTPNIARKDLLRQSRCSAKELNEALQTLKEAGEVDWATRREEGSRKPSIHCFIPRGVNE